MDRLLQMHAEHEARVRRNVRPGSLDVVGVDRAPWIVVSFRFLPDVEKFRGVPIQLLLTWRHILRFFARTKNDRRIGRAKNTAHQRDKERENSKFHWDWQGN